jgi:hypothetical protein
MLKERWLKNYQGKKLLKRLLFRKKKLMQKPRRERPRKKHELDPKKIITNNWVFTGQFTLLMLLTLIKSVALNQIVLAGV